MDAQLRLLGPDDTSARWRLDDRTRVAGLHGVALARQALRRARQAAGDADEEDDRSATATSEASAA